MKDKTKSGFDVTTLWPAKALKCYFRAELDKWTGLCSVTTEEGNQQLQCHPQAIRSYVVIKWWQCSSHQLSRQGSLTSSSAVCPSPHAYPFPTAVLWVWVCTHKGEVCYQTSVAVRLGNTYFSSAFPSLSLSWFLPSKVTWPFFMPFLSPFMFLSSTSNSLVKSPNSDCLPVLSISPAYILILFYTMLYLILYLLNDCRYLFF